jgi:amino acid adenylation domain-containing protein
MNLARALQERLASDSRGTVLRSGDRSWTAAEFDGVTRAVAEGLVRRGVRPDDVVQLVTSDHVEAVLLMVGVLRAGAAFCVVPPTYPQRRMQSIQERVRPVARLDSLAEALPAPGEQPAAPVPLPDRTADSLSYVIFTSGSTGDPKAVEIVDRGLAHLISQPGLYRGHTMGHAAALQFDACIYEIFGALLNGMTLQVLDVDEVTDHATAGRALAGVDTLFLTTQVFNLMADRDPEVFDGLDTVIFGGERVSPAHVRKVVGRCRVLHAYGPTETTVYATLHEVTAPVGPDVPIGRSLVGGCLHVVDAEGQPVPDGEVGELLVGGPGLMRGYRGQPEATAEAMAQLHDAPHYRTGDLVRSDVLSGARPGTDGVITYIGRKDRQLKISGHRVDPLEIEQVAQDFLAGCGRAGQALVVGDGRRLRLFVTGCTDLAGLRRHLRQVLPGYLVPVVTAVGYLPLTGNGKTDVARLLEQARASSPTQERARQVFAALLPTGAYDPTATFAELGGDSLQAMEALWQLDQHGVRIDMAALLTQPLERVLQGV